MKAPNTNTLTKKEVIKVLFNSQKEYERRFSFTIIERLVSSGVISKVDNDCYKIVNKNKYHTSYYYEETKKIIGLLDSVLSFSDYIVYDVTFLNEWLNQLIGRNTIIIETPKDTIGVVYDALVDAGYKNIMVDPSIFELNKYMSSNSIIIKPLFSRAPIDKKKHENTIEKIIVDLFVDKIVQQYFSLNELSYVYEQIFKKYAIDEVSLKAYLKRRNCFNRFYEFLKNKGLEDKIND